MKGLLKREGLPQGFIENRIAEIGEIGFIRDCRAGKKPLYFAHYVF
jgi:hypothetical protein